MTEQKIIAQRRKNYSRLISLIVLFLGCAAFMVIIYFTETDEPEAYVWLLIAAVFAIIAVIPLILFFRERRLPEVLIWLESGVLHFYNGCECRAEDIQDINSTYDSTQNGAVLNSGKIVIYTNKGKIVCRRIKDLAYSTTAILSFKYGRVYTTEELKIKMARRAGL